MPNPITMFLLAAVLIGFLGPVIVILSYVDKIRASHARDNERTRTLQIREETAQRAQALHEARLAKEANAVLLQDLKIEAAKLQLIELQKKIQPTEYEVKDY